MKGSSSLFVDYSANSSSLEGYSGYSAGKSFSSYSSSPLHGNSQPYSKQYSVYGKMVKKDLKYGIYNADTGYAKNPTAQSLNSIIRGNYIVDKHFTKQVPYVVTTEGKVIIGNRNGNGRAPGALPTPHPTLIGGRDPKVRIAGILDIRGGKIYSYNNHSGHYRPNEKSMRWADEAFKSFPKHKHFIGGEE